MATDFHLKYAAGLARGVADRGSPVMLLTRPHDLEFGGRPGAMRAHLERVLDGKVQPVFVPGRVRDASLVPALVRIRRSLRRFNADVVHLQDGVLNDARLIPLSGARPGRYALTVHDPNRHPTTARIPLRSRALRQGLIRGAGLIIVHGDALREEMIELHRPRAPVVVIPHGIDAPSFQPLPSRPSLLFFGRIQVYKGLEVLLDAMPEVWQQAPEVSLTVAGRGDLPAHPALADARVTLRHEHVPEDDLADLYSASTCVVLPYTQASQSGVGSLAKQYGRAVVATAVGALPELVPPTVGRVVAPGDPKALAGAILELVRDRATAEAMGRAAAASAVEDAGWTRVAELTLEAYRLHLLHDRRY